MNLWRRRTIFISLTLFLIVVGSQFALAKDAFYPLEKVEPGMKGFGYSVFSGTKIERFNAEVLAVVEGDTWSDKLILVKLSGRIIEKSGGLAAGMSGSPIYIKKRLVGAISYGFENADSYLALVTPIENMLKMLPASEKKSLAAGRPLILKDGLIFKPVITPVVISGAGRRGFESFKKALEPYNFKPVFFFGSKKKQFDSGFVTLKPGSAVAVQMVSGDYQVAAIGTVTLVEDDYFLAFGHSFTNRGKVDYLAFQAHILHTVKSPVMSFKLGLPLQIAGRIIEDRQPGILGKFGEYPSLIPVAVTVRDLDRDLERGFSFQVIQNEQLYRDLIISGVTDAIDQTIDRVGSGTAVVRLQIELENRESIIRENYFYGKDIAVSCLKDLRDLLDLLAANEFLQLTVKSVKVNVDVQEKQASARIIKIETDRSKVKPGSVVKVQVVARTFRGQNLTIPFEIKLPSNIEPGKLTISAHGTANVFLEAESEGRKPDTSKTGSKKAASLDELINDFLNETKNNQVVLEYQLNEDSGSDDRNLKKEINQKVDTTYCIHGEAQFDLEII
ncbi:MAG: hypothetical protein GX075_07840 [Firmicutes bacterium]|nr:hypothetical protein [Bacillota bacterium]